MLIYLGRRGFSRFALDMARATVKELGSSSTLVVSRQNENHALFMELGSKTVSVDTFSHNAGAMLNAWRIPIIRSRLGALIDEVQPDIVLDLMPHVWSPFIFTRAFQRSLRYIPIIHDYRPHTGDYRSASIAWLLRRALRRADTIFTLSGAVAGRLKADSSLAPVRVVPLFHPDLEFGGYREFQPPNPGGPLRLLFFGRIMRYKGLPVFLDMIDELRSRGFLVEFGIIGEGDLDASMPRLMAMKAEIVNRWLTEAEIGHHLPRFHAMVLSHIEASQSGVAAAALGAGLPVIATPVGGIIEQIIHRETGLIAKRADAAGLADAAETLLDDRGLYAHLCHRIHELRGERSMERFVQCCLRSANLPRG